VPVPAVARLARHQLRGSGRLRGRDLLERQEPAVHGLHLLVL
jgi:hypothetical protein